MIYLVIAIFFLLRHFHSLRFPLLKGIFLYNVAVAPSSRSGMYLTNQNETSPIFLGWIPSLFSSIYTYTEKGRVGYQRNEESRYPFNAWIDYIYIHAHERYSDWNRPTQFSLTQRKERKQFRLGQDDPAQ